MLDAFVQFVVCANESLSREERGSNSRALNRRYYRYYRCCRCSLAAVDSAAAPAWCFDQAGHHFPAAGDYRRRVAVCCHRQAEDDYRYRAAACCHHQAGDDCRYQDQARVVVADNQGLALAAVPAKA